MPTNRENIELAFNIEMETRKVMKSVSNIDRALKGVVNQKLKIKAFDTKSIKEFSKQVGKSKKDLRDIAFSLSPKQRAVFDKDFAKMTKSYKKLTRVTLQERTKVRNLEKAFAKETDKTVRDSIKKQLDAQKKLSLKEVRQQRDVYAKKRRGFGKNLVATGATASIEKRGESAKRSKEFVEGIKSHKTGAALADGFKDAMGAMSGKDIFGFGKAGVKISSGLLKGLAKKSLAQGAMKQAGGKGGVLGSLAPMIEGFSKILPVLGLVAGAVVGIIKLLLDADAAVKDMNKDILEGSSTWEDFASQGRDADKGLDHIKETLKDIRDQTTDISMNWTMGTNAKEHRQVLNNLFKEGVAREKISQQLKANQSDVNNLNRSMTKWTDISGQAIAYSRLFGVSVDDITNLQAEMMTELGMNLQSVSKEFDLIGNSAEQSGIAANKFFAILRGVSSDLALYGVRIGEVTKMLGQLGKVMSPRTADKFLKEFAKGFKGTTIQDRLKATLLGGPKGIKVTKESIEEQKKDLISQVSESAGVGPEDAAEILRGKKVKGQSLKGLEKAGKVTGSGAMQEAFQNLDLAAEQLKHGTYGAAMALENVGGIGAYKQRKAQLQATAGTGSFQQAMKGGVAGERWATTAAGGEENVKAMIGIERAIEQQKNDLVGSIDGTEDEQETLLKTLKRFHKVDEKMTIKDLAGQKDLIAKQVESLSEDQLWASVSEKQAKENQSQADKDAAEMIKQGQKQGDLTQGMLAKLELIFDALYNWIYEILGDILDLMPGRKATIKKQVMESKSKDVLDAWKKGGGDVGKYMGELAGSETAKQITKVLASTNPEDAKRQDQLKDVILKNTGGANIEKAMEDLNLPKSIKDAYIQAQFKVGSKQAISDTMTPGDEAALYAKLGLWESDDIGRTRIMAQAGNVLGTSGMTSGGGTAAPPAAATQTAPAPQQAAAQKSENPGTAGTPVVAAPSFAPTVPGAGPAASAAPGGLKMPTLPDEQKLNQAAIDSIDFTGEATVNSLQDLWKALRMKGIKLDKMQLHDDVQDVIHKGTADGARDALFEYALYTSANPAETLKKMKNSGFGGLGKLADTFEDQQKQAKAEGKETLIPGANAAGGIVTDVGGGLANVSPAPGEGLASIGRGEKIVPAGGGGAGAGGIHIHVNGIGGQDLANFLSTKIAQGVHEYKRREKFN